MIVGVRSLSRIYAVEQEVSEKSGGKKMEPNKSRWSQESLLKSDARFAVGDTTCSLKTLRFLWFLLFPSELLRLRISSDNPFAVLGLCHQ